MTNGFAKTVSASGLPLWNRMKKKRLPLSFDMELTARCNNNCRHCYINLPFHDEVARKGELSLQMIDHIAGQAVSMGTLWCLLTGGEPLLREDFYDIYLALKRRGLLISVFTNACLVTKEHIDLFLQYPPRHIEVTVYGVSESTYEAVTRLPGSFAAFRRGLDLLMKSGLPVRLKAMALRSNAHELMEIADFCRRKAGNNFRFDPFLHLRYDRNSMRNEEIRSERLPPDELIALELADRERLVLLKKTCRELTGEDHENPVTGEGEPLFRCGAGIGSFTVGFDGTFRLCSSLWHPDCIYDLTKGTLAEAWYDFVPRVRRIKSVKPEYTEKCNTCRIFNMCMWCPAHAHLERDGLDAWIESFCLLARRRVEAIEQV